MAPSASVSEAAAKTVTALLSATAPGSAVNAKQAANSAASARRIFMASPNKRDIQTNITRLNACQPWEYQRSWLFGGAVAKASGFVAQAVANLGGCDRSGKDDGRCQTRNQEARQIARRMRRVHRRIALDPESVGDLYHKRPGDPGQKRNAQRRENIVGADEHAQQNDRGAGEIAENA